MAASTPFTELVGCRLPIQLAPMGGVGTTALAAAVANAGGLGMVPSGCDLPGGLCGMNFLVPFAPAASDVAAAAGRARVVEFFGGDPSSELVDVVHGAGGLAGWQVGSAHEAGAAEKCGCDYVAIQGHEAGGHVRATEPLDVTLRATLEAVDLAVVAAGGVATPERVAEVMAMGASAVRVGTRFLATEESGAHASYIRAVLEATGEQTALTDWFGEGWEDAPHRVLGTALERARESGWRAPIPPYEGIDRGPDDMAMYAGTGVGTVRSRESAGAVVEELARLL